MVRPESKLLDYLNPKESVFLLNISIFITPSSTVMEKMAVIGRL